MLLGNRMTNVLIYTKPPTQSFIFFKKDLAVAKFLPGDDCDSAHKVIRFQLT